MRVIVFHSFQTYRDGTTYTPEALRAHDGEEIEYSADGHSEKVTLHYDEEKQYLYFNTNLNLIKKEDKKNESI